MSDTDITPTSTPVTTTTGLDIPSASLTGPSWQEQDAALRDLWLQNKTPQEISAVLNRSVAAIMTRAARLGLPRRSAPGRKPGSRRLLTNNGQPPIARQTQARHSARAADGAPAPQISTRICLMCLRPFQSQGRHNRICSSCKSSSEYESAVSIPDIHIPV